MIIVEKQALKFLLAGRKITVTTRREHKKGRTYAVGVRHNRTVCRARIVEVTENADGWLLEIRQHDEEQPVYLAANPGAIRADYTIILAQAARDSFGGPIEAVDHEWACKMAKVASERDDLTRRETARQDRLSRWRVRLPTVVN